MTIEALLKDIEVTTNPEDRYELLVEAWDLIVQENEEQRNLVSSNEWSTWKSARKRLGESLYDIGASFVKDGTWDTVKIDRVSQSFLGATRKTATELIEKNSQRSKLRDRNIAADQEMQKKRSILKRIKRIPR